MALLNDKKDKDKTAARDEAAFKDYQHKRGPGRPRKDMPDGSNAPVLGTITWLGEGDDGPRTNTWNGLTFKVGEPVEVTSQRMIEKAKHNRFYEVSENDAKPEAPVQPIAQQAK